MHLLKLKMLLLLLLLPRLRCRESRPYFTDSSHCSPGSEGSVSLEQLLIRRGRRRTQGG